MPLSEPLRILADAQGYLNSRFGESEDRRERCAVADALGIIAHALLDILHEGDKKVVE